jgi:hypothetical protein
MPERVSTAFDDMSGKTALNEMVRGAKMIPGD